VNGSLLSINDSILRSKRSMIRKETSSDTRRTSGKPLASLGRWLCGHNPSDKHLSVQSSLFSFRDEPSFSNDAFSSSIDFQDVATFGQFEAWDKTLAQMFVSWCAQDWLKPLPDLLEVAPEVEPEPLNRRGEFLRYGSDFLRYKSETANVQCSRIALFLAGGFRNETDLSNAGFGKSFKFKDSASAFFSNSLGSSPLNAGPALEAVQSFLHRLNVPASLGSPKTIAQSFIALESKFAILLPWDNVEQPWSMPLQVTTAIAVALPILLSSAQVYPSLQLRATPLLSWGVSSETSTAPVKASSPTRPSLATPTKARIRFTKPTGRLANIQTYVLPAKGEFTSGYGWRWGRMHRGMDIAGPVGTPVVAAASGKVITASWDDSGFGNRIEIQHPDGTVTLYGHNNRIVTHVGATVRQGQQIAEMGSTGNSTGPHLHFQVHPAGKEAANPMAFLAGQKLVLPPAGT
jgi:murein DD-endopeptidase MepM/ murein hydrolase activator NlpD